MFFGKKKVSKVDFKFEIGQVVEMVWTPADDEFISNVIRRFTHNEDTVQELVNLDEARDGDLCRVCERWIKKDNDNVEHDLYLCQNLQTQEYTLFGRSGLREHV